MLTVEESHPGLSRLLALALISAKAKRTLLVIAPSGTGKSMIGRCLSKVYDKYLGIDSTTLVGLEEHEAILNNFSGLVYIDDMGSIDNSYARMATLTVLSELCYKGWVNKHSARVHLDIQGFNGSVILNVQPVILKYLILSSQWDANVQDKVVRYYHFHRPTKLSDDDDIIMPDVPNFDLADISIGSISPKILQDLQITADVQWSMSRSREHMRALLKSIAGINGHNTVDDDDAAELADLMRPCRAERWLIMRDNFEGSRRFEDGLCYLITEWSTYGNFTLQNIERNYKLSQSTAYQLMNRYSKYWDAVKQSPTRFIPTNRPVFANSSVSMQYILKDLGVIKE